MTPAATAPSLPPGMHFIQRDWLSANGVLFDDGQQLALIDTGYIKHRDMTLSVLRHLIGKRLLDLIINTHLHSDHCGGNALLQATYGAHTLIPAASAQAVAQWDTKALTFAETGQRCERFKFDGLLEDGQMLSLGGLQWQAMAAPGHDPEALIFYCASHRILISADALWENGFGVIFPELEGESGFSEQRAILERIGTLDIDLVLPGHGPMFTDARAALDRAHRRLDHLSADAGRNARHATKVMLRFLLLEHERLPLARVQPLMEGMSLIARANERYIGMTPDALSQWAMSELVRAGAARIDDGMLLNTD